MDGSDQMWFGVFFIAGGSVILVLDVMKRRAIYAILLSLFFVALGVGLLLKLYTLDPALGVMVVLSGGQSLVDGIKRRSAKTIVGGIACAAAGAGILAQLYAPTSVIGVYLAADGCWSLPQAIRARSKADILYYSGMAAMGIGFVGVWYTEWCYLLVFLGSLAIVARLWIAPSAARQLTTDN